MSETTNEEVSSPQQEEPEEDQGIKFKDWGFKIDRLFEVAYRFYKRNESKAFHPSFDVRNQMNALILQARYGNFDGGKAPDIGTLDLVGKSRRHQWSMLKGMSKTEAMSKFICTLDNICPFFKAYAEAVKISSGIQDQTRWNDGNQVNGGELATRGLALESDEQLKAIHTSLCKQTYNQFKSYAEKQYPTDTNQQKFLISSLQEQYYQQYISQMHPELKGMSNGNFTLTPPLKQKPKLEETKASSLPSDLKDAPVRSDQVQSYIEQSNLKPDAWSYASSSGADSPIEQSPPFEPLEPATIWTKKGVSEFKNSLVDDKHSGFYEVKQGTLLTIQVPTYPDGKYIYWEFITEDYDIGFGLDFIYEAILEKPLSLRIYEEADEDELDEMDELGAEMANYNLESSLVEADKSNGVQKLERRRAEKLARLSNTISIVPTYRRDSHEEIFVGRHRYFARGYYLLKFDNTYSVLRSKSLYFRICYFI